MKIPFHAEPGHYKSNRQDASKIQTRKKNPVREVDETMHEQPIRITVDALSNETEGRFHRFGLIGWWDQERLSQAKALVIGAGALGNEIVKNLALLGWGNILVADMDHIENSNLSRSVLYREQDNGRPKSIVAVEAAKDIYPELKSHAFHGNVVHDLGLGVFRWADIVFGGLDNREARLSINRNCWKVNRPWVDGAIEQIQGCARLFVPDGPCYECTMSDLDWKLLQRRQSCNLLSRDEMQGGKTPTTPTISSVIAGVQCQEAIKWLHGLPTIEGKGWVFDGLSGESYLVAYQRKEECFSHELLDEVISLDWKSSDTTVAELLSKAKQLIGDDAELELSRDVLEKLVCPKCNEEEYFFASLGQVGIEKAICPKCLDVQREVVTFYKIRGDETFMGRTLRDIGVPAFDIVIARSEHRVIGLEFSGDAIEILGPLVSNEEAVEWM